MTSPDLTLAICTFNNSVLLDRTLESIERQHVHDAGRWSVIIVDNNSTDDTRRTVERYIQTARIPGLRLVQESRQGLSHARHRAILETLAPVIAFVDDDCLLEPDWIQQALVFAGRHPRAGAFGGRVSVIWERPADALMLRHADSFAEQNLGDSPRQMPDSGFTYLVGAGLIVRRDAVLVSGWLERRVLLDRRGRALTSGGDTELVLRIRNAGYQLWYNPAMRLSHFISGRRMHARHLCGLQRGFGRSSPVHDALVRQSVPPVAERLRTLRDDTKDLCRRLLTIAGSDRTQQADWRRDALIQLCWTVGRVEGDLRMLLSGCRL